MKQENKPKFKHDCESCVFLGHEEGADLYYCPLERAGAPFWARLSEKECLHAGPAGARQHPALRRAMELAADQGWIIDPADKFDSIPGKAREEGRFHGWEKV
jgi:hypothetical protein